MKKPAVATTALFLIVFILSAAPCFSDPGPAAGADLPKRLREIVPAATLEKLAAPAGPGETTSNFNESGNLSLLPKTPFADRILGGIRGMKPTFGVETLILRKVTGTPDSSANALKLYNILLSVSTLKGITYYSASRREMREFFIESYRTDGPNSRTRLPDLAAQAIPAAESFFGFQHDSSFGENNYKINYLAQENMFLMEMVNTNLIWYGIVPIVDPGNLRYYIMIVPIGEYILFYSAICVNGANPFGLMEQRAASFYNRIKALETWFITRYAR